MDKDIFEQHLINSGIIVPRFEEDGVTPTETSLREIEKAGELFDAFKIISNFVNNFSADEKVFREAIILGIGHGTLQQSFNAMIFKYIVYMASDEYREKRTNGRNIESHDVAKMLVESFEKEYRYKFTGNLSCV